MRRMPAGNILQHKFALAPQVNIPRSKFDRSFSHKTTINEGFLYPIVCDEMLPGDTFNIRMDAYIRMLTPLFPIMDNLYFETFWFFVPNRLLWDNWERFNGAQDNPGDSTDYLVPTTESPAVTGIAQGTLCDYMGIPTKVPNLVFNSLHLRAYNKIWNDWFRDENLQDSVLVPTDDGPDDIADFVLLRRGKRRDYFTSCLPFPQKGPTVELPLGTTAPVIPNPLDPSPIFSWPSTGIPDSKMQIEASSTDARFINTNTTGVAQLTNWGNPNLLADLSTATAATINDLRLAFQTQRLYERDARGGTRYQELIMSHFHVLAQDSRLQRSEYISGQKTPVIIAPVAQTGAPETNKPLGLLGAYGVAAPSNNGCVFSAPEHGVFIGLASVRADLNYQQGLERMWSRQTRFDFYWPVFAHLGEQAVLNKEIYAQGTAADEEVFGYQERFAEYRYKPSLVTGLFRSNATGTLDAWHLAQDFGSLPVLNDEFIVEDAPMSRISAIPSEPDFKLDMWFKYHCARPMPVYAVPGLIDHF